jgi:hypothetical protein
VKLLTRNEARLASLMLIQLQRSTDVQQKETTERWLFATVRARDPYAQELDMLPVLAKLVEWDIIHRTFPEGYEPMRAWDFNYNLLNTPILKIWPQHLVLFADLSRQAFVVGSYEVLVYRRDWFSDGAQWEASVLRTHREVPNHELPAAIIVHAIRKVLFWSPVNQTAPSFQISAKQIVDAVQYDLAPVYPLLSPLVIQAWFEHPYVATCVDFVNKILQKGDGHPNAVYEIGGITQVPTLDECKAALAVTEPGYPFHCAERS